MGLSDDLGQSIDFNIIKNYIDENNQNQIYSKEKSFKLVGILKSQMDFMMKIYTIKLKLLLNTQKIKVFYLKN
ncbi:hypothetical protein Q5M85_16415 [Paraclostridium bifermentans]|nr:hypothetical protein [Paraclostridium bifermentans]